MRELEELLKFLDYYNSCAVQGHVPIKMWSSTGTEEDAPDGVSVTCARCGGYLREG